MKNKVQTSVGLWAVWFIFALCTLFIGAYHEPWADEAQAWLIGRDATVWEILSEYARLEGQPPLWHLLLRGLILCGLPYSCFFLVAWVFSVAGVGLFLWKSPFPKWLKALIPFTYFIFFQYTIVARQYCLALLFLSWIAIVYPTRHERPFRYALALCLSGFSSLPALLVSGSLYFLFLCENLRLKTERAKNWLSAGLIFGFMLLMTAILFPELNNPYISDRWVDITPTERFFILFPSIITMTFFSDKLDSWHWNTALYIATVLVIGSFFWKNKKNLLAVLILYTPLLLLFTLLCSQIWHLGHLFLLLIFCLWIFYDQTQFKPVWTNIRLWLLSGVFVLHIGWSAYLGWYDAMNPYSAGKVVAQFIKPYQTSGKTIMATNFWTVAVQPYFPENIFVNWNKGFWVYKQNAKNYRLLEFLSKNPLPDIILADVAGAMQDEGQKFFEQINATNQYQPGIAFQVRMPTKQHEWEQLSLAVFIKKSYRD